MRIASFLASATEMVCALGLADRLVAISHECDWPPDVLDRPRVSRPLFDPAGLSSGEIDAAVRRTLAAHGRVYDLDAEVLRAVRPDLLLTQEVCEVCAVPTSLAHRAAALLDRMPRVLSLDAHSLAEILGGLAQIAAAAGVPERAGPLMAGLEARLAAVRAAVAGRPHPRVLALEWLDPVFVPGHWGPEMIATAGGDDLFGRSGERSRTLPWEVVADANPDVLLVVPCGYGLDQAHGEAEVHRARLERVAPRAIASGRAWVMDASAYFNRSGPRVVDGVEALGAILHPEALPEASLAGRATRWA